MRVTIQDGIDPRKFQKFIYAAVTAGAEAQARAQQAIEADRRKLMQKAGVTPPAVQGSLFEGEE
jgi:hypothetical protein